MLVRQLQKYLARAANGSAPRMSRAAVVISIGMLSVTLMILYRGHEMIASRNYDV